MCFKTIFKKIIISSKKSYKNTLLFLEKLIHIKSFKEIIKNNYIKILKPLGMFFAALGHYILLFHIYVFITFFIFSMLFKYFNPPITSLMIYRNIFYHQANKKLVFIPIKYTTRKTQKLFVIAEDCNFYKHNGIDIDAILNAYEKNKKIGYHFFGGSTITQQLARTLFLTPKKNYFRKYVEMLIALEMDLFIKKQRILELYINYAEFGRGIYGIGMASWVYYGKSFYNLSDDEILRLVTILPSPLKFNPSNYQNNKNLLTRYNSILLRIS